ncbi:hypothetical protein [Cloacibacterium normanense]|uniref:hypothetical protein n=1 Tax=Cloacibacterium normanense TaxID=237258 RepID=UPI00352F8AE3
MKKIISLLFFFSLSMLFGQNITDYEYIYVPKKFKDFEANEYNLNTLLKKSLEAKIYKVIQDDIVNWPLELRQNPCKVLNADLLNDSNMFRNRVKLQFSNCEKNVIFETKGSSMIKDFELGYQDAMNISLKNLQNSQPKEIEVLVKPTEKTVVETVVEKPVQAVVASSNSATPEVAKKAESYSNGAMSFQKIQISKDQFILVSSSSSVPFATFKNTTKSDVYRVTLENGTSTLGYTENGNLVIEIPTSDGNYKKEVFTTR